jgi:hypothetical protein
MAFSKELEESNLENTSTSSKSQFMLLLFTFLNIINSYKNIFLASIAKHFSTFYISNISFLHKNIVFLQNLKFIWHFILFKNMLAKTIQGKVFPVDVISLLIFERATIKNKAKK